jgi:hypothetical protein
MHLEQWYYIACIVSACAAVLGLGGLVWYAIETWKLRKAAQDQLETMNRPCVLMIENIDQTLGFDNSPLMIENVGAGVALNIRWRVTKPKPGKWQECRSLGAGKFQLSRIYIRHVVDDGPIECEFESLSGFRYLTTAEFSKDSPNLDLRHTFKKIGD